MIQFVGHQKKNERNLVDFYFSFAVVASYTSNSFSSSPSFDTSDHYVYHQNIVTVCVTFLGLSH